MSQRLTLTVKERAALDALNPAFGRYLDEAGPQWTARCTALKKVTTILRSEREALQELSAVGLLREHVADQVHLRVRLDVTRARMEALAGDNEHLRAQLGAVTAEPAMVSYGD